MILKTKIAGGRARASPSLPRLNLPRLAAVVLLIAFGTAPAAIAARSDRPVGWQEPIIGLQARILSDYQAPAYPWGSGHRGIDAMVDVGEVIYSPTAGSVHFAGRVVNRGVLSIIDDHGRIASFEPVCSLLSIGFEVQPGDAIAVYCEPDPGYQSHCVGDCMHFSARLDGAYLSPLHLIYGLQPSRLWPLPQG
jgi:hypothetical protein